MSRFRKVSRFRQKRRRREAGVRKVDGVIPAGTRMTDVRAFNNASAGASTRCLDAGVDEAPSTGDHSIARSHPWRTAAFTLSQVATPSAP